MIKNYTINFAKMLILLQNKNCKGKHNQKKKANNSKGKRNFYKHSLKILTNIHFHDYTVLWKKDSYFLKGGT